MSNDKLDHSGQRQLLRHPRGVSGPGGLYWKQTRSNIGVNDVVYVYVGKPYSQVQVKSVVVARDVPRDVFLADAQFDDRPFSKVSAREYRQQLAETPAFIKLKLLQTCESMPELSLSALREHGLRGNVQGPRLLENNPELHAYIERTAR